MPGRRAISIPALTCRYCRTVKLASRRTNHQGSHRGECPWPLLISGTTTTGPFLRKHVQSGADADLDDEALLCIQFVCLRIVKEKFLWDAAERYPKASKYLAAWVKTVRAAEWRNLGDVRQCYSSADVVLVG